MRWLHPWLLLWLALLPGLGWLEARWYAWRRRRLESFAQTAFQTGLARPRLDWRWGAKSALLAGGLLLAVLALARPQGPPEAIRDPDLRFVNLYVVLDVSLSMGARDLKPSRLAAGRVLVEEVQRRLPGSRLGLIAFADSARLLCPATFDHGALRAALARAEPGMLPEGGSNPAAGVGLALDKLAKLDGPGRAVLLITDGEEHQDSGLPDLAGRAGALGVPLLVVGTGSLKGAPVPLGRDFWGKQQYRTYRGRMVTSRLRSLDLRKAARFSGGAYLELDDPVQEAGAAAARLRSWGQKASRESGRKVRREYFPWLAGGALLLLWLESLAPRFAPRTRTAPAPAGGAVPRVPRLPVPAVPGGGARRRGIGAPGPGRTRTREAD